MSCFFMSCFYVTITRQIDTKNTVPLSKSYHCKFQAAIDRKNRMPMPNLLLTPLADLLHKLNSQTISRSLEYVSRIDLGQPSANRKRLQTTQLQAHIKGTKNTIPKLPITKPQSTYFPSQVTVKLSRGQFCKHGAALARLLQAQESKPAMLVASDYPAISNLSKSY